MGGMGGGSSAAGRGSSTGGVEGSSTAGGSPAAGEGASVAGGGGGAGSLVVGAGSSSAGGTVSPILLPGKLLVLIGGEASRDEGSRVACGVTTRLWPSAKKKAHPVPQGAQYWASRGPPRAQVPDQR